MPSWSEIKEKVEANDNILTIPMTDLKEAVGKDKLGVHVRSEISRTLAGMGLGHIPQDLPKNQNEYARLYKRGTVAGELIETVLCPGEPKDRKLIELFAESKVNHAEIIEQIRELVAE
jgi:hypothetical protein